MIRRTFKLVGRRIAGTYGRTAKKYQKRLANKSTRQLTRHLIHIGALR